jgi:hypothetical protein
MLVPDLGMPMIITDSIQKYPAIAGRVSINNSRTTLSSRVDDFGKRRVKQLNAIENVKRHCDTLVTDVIGRSDTHTNVVQSLVRAFSSKVAWDCDQRTVNKRQSIPVE